MRRITVVLVFCLLSCIHASPDSQSSGTATNSEVQLQKAREALTGKTKDTEAAKKILLEVVKSGRPAFSSESLCYAYVYLGYIADRAGNREEAIAWYTKAAAVRDAGTGILEVARRGIETPVTWIRHLDQGEPPPRQTQAVPASPAASSGTGINASGGYVTTLQPPAGLIPAETLSAERRRQNLEFLWDAIDRTYACFTLKSIDWRSVHTRYLERLNSVTTTDEFYSLLFQLVNELKDTHSWLSNYRPSTPAYGPGLSIDLFEGKPYLVAVTPNSSAAAAGAKTGSEILAVDGLTIEGNGSEPDIAVSPSITDFLADKDPVLDKAVAFLGGGK